MSKLHITLDQWLVFQTVIEEGSFANAADKLHRSQSTISYSVQRLESLLNIKLLSKEGRKAVLTEHGRQVFLHARQITQAAVDIEQSVSDLGRGIEYDITLMIDGIFPRRFLRKILKRFYDLNYMTRLILREGILSGPSQSLIEGQADIAIVSKLPSNYIGDKLLEVESIAYAHPSHPLHHLKRPILKEDLRKHHHVVVMDSGTKNKRDEGWLSSQLIWNVDSIDLKIELVANNTGFAWLPKAIVEEKGCDLKPLNLQEGCSRVFPLYLANRNKKQLGPASHALLEIIKNVCHERV